MKTTIVFLATLLASHFLSAQNAAALIESGLAKDKAQDYKGAIVDLSKAITLDPKNARAIMHRGIAEYYLDDSKAAMSDYNKAI